MKVGDSDLLRRRPAAEGERGRRPARTPQAPAARRPPGPARASGTSTITSSWSRSPPGVNTVRHPAELEWSEERRAARPDARRPDAVGHRTATQPPGARAAAPAHRPPARQGDERPGRLRALGAGRARTRAAVPQAHGRPARISRSCPDSSRTRTIKSSLVADRGDGRRGSTQLPDVGKEAITHVAVEERLPGYTILSCRLETGRTHQIRIHLAEAGHPVCGDKVYVKNADGDGVRGQERRAAAGAARDRTRVRTPGHGESTCTGRCRLPGDLAKFVEKLKGAS